MQMLLVLETILQWHETSQHNGVQLKRVAGVCPFISLLQTNVDVENPEFADHVPREIGLPHRSSRHRMMQIDDDINTQQQWVSDCEPNKTTEKHEVFHQHRLIWIIYIYYNIINYRIYVFIISYTAYQISHSGYFPKSLTARAQVRRLCDRGHLWWPGAELATVGAQISS